MKFSQEYVLIFLETYFIYKNEIFEYHKTKSIKIDVNNLSRYMNIQLVISYQNRTIELDIRSLDIDFETIKDKLKHLKKLSHLEWCSGPPTTTTK
jgi:hypothetical protein